MSLPSNAIAPESGCSVRRSFGAWFLTNRTDQAGEELAALDLERNINNGPSERSAVRYRERK